MDHHRHIYIQLQIALRSTDADTCIIGHDLHGYHGDGFALGRIYLTGHDGRTGFIFGNIDFPQTTARAACQPADIVRNFHQICRQPLQSTMHKYDLILCCQGVEFIFRCNKRNACQFGNFFCRRFRKACRSIQPCTDGCAAQRQFCHFCQTHFDHFFTFFQHISPAGNFLRESDGCGILQMGSASFDDPLIFLFQSFQFCDHSFHSRDQFLFCFQHSGNMHGCGEGIVRALAHIDMVIGMQQFFPCNFIAAVGNHFIHVHIGLCTAACLPYRQRELIIQFACQHLIADLSDDLTSSCIQFAQSMVCLRHCLFQNSKGIGDLLRHLLRADFEVFITSLGLCPPISIRRHFHFAHGVFFNTIFHNDSPLYIYA